MAKKSNTEKKKEKGGKVSAILSIVLSCFLLIVSLSRQGPVGIITNNIFCYLFGKFYPILLVVSVITSLATVFGHKFHFTFYFGLVIFTVAAFVLSGKLFGSGVTNFEQFKDMAILGVHIFDTDPSMMWFDGAGLTGTGLYLLCRMLIDETLTLVFTGLALFIGLLLLVPHSWYKEIVDRAKARREERKAEREQERIAYEKELQLEKEEEEKKRIARKEEEQRKLEEDRLRLAEEISRANDLEEYRKVEVVPEPKKTGPKLDMSSKSSFFLDMSSSDDKDEEFKDTAPIQIPLDELPSAKRKRVITKNGKYTIPNYKEVLEAKEKIKVSNINKSNAEIKGKKLIEILNTFDIDATLLNTYIGPSVTKFEIKPDTNVKVNKILTIQDNIKMELAAKDIRIEAPISGRNAVGVEIPNVENTPVRMIELVPELPKDSFNTTFALGKGLLGNNVFCDIRKMPHLLIAGATGSGKSVCENAIITSILLRSHPDDVKLVLVDPKKVEFTPYHDVPHLLWPVITDTKMAILMLEKLVVIMEQRYEKFAQANAKNIETYNQYVEDCNADLEEGEVPLDPMPYIVVIIDELADLMATSKNEVIGSIQRITQLARASGIHLIVATQRPSTDIINGVIKNNIPSRIAFSMPTSVDSRTILDQVGAERLLGRGDMLYSPQGEPAPIRLQGVYVTDKEIDAITKAVKSKGAPNYDDTYYTILNNGNESGGTGCTNTSEVDPLYNDVVEFVKSAQKASTSLLQRRFGIGFNRSARIIDTLEEKGIIGPANGSKAREVLIKPDED